MKKMNIERQIKLAISILLGIGITFLSFFAFVTAAFFTIAKILWILVFAFYISTIVFLFLWNMKKSRKKYILLSIPAVCILTGVIAVKYTIYVQNIPVVNEAEVNMYFYQPFSAGNMLAKLEGEAKYKITDNLPVLDGATALYPVYAAFVNAVYPEDKYDPENSAVLCSRTIDAYNNLLTGKADIIFCAGPSKEQMQEFLSMGINIKFIPIGKEAFVFFVNKENPVTDLKVEDIQNIYSGKIKNWKKLGGANESIRIYQRPDNSGSQTALKKIMGNMTIVKPGRENVSEGMGTIVNKVASYRNFKNAIGYSFLHFLTVMAENYQIRLLSINNIYPLKETIQDNSYPFCDVFYAIYIEKENMNTSIKPFIEWTLSKQGQEIIEKTGYVPIAYFF
jgi:phosphate transport system substrate-binding protein